MSLETSLQALITAIGTDIKTILTGQGTLTSLTTTERTNLVGAVNELKTNLTTLEGQIAAATNINDSGAESSTTETYSIYKILDVVTAAKNAVKADILGSAPAALDTLQELAAALSDNPSFATDIATALGTRVRVDAAQSFDSSQQTQGRANIGAAAASDLTQLQTDLGDVTADLAALYTTAKT